MVHFKAVRLFFRSHKQETSGIIRPEHTTVLIFNDLHILRNGIILTWKEYLKNILARFLFSILEVCFPVSYLLEISGSVAILFIFYMFSFFISLIIFLSLFLCQKMTCQPPVQAITCPSPFLAYLSIKRSIASEAASRVEIIAQKIKLRNPLGSEGHWRVRREESGVTAAVILDGAIYKMCSKCYFQSSYRDGNKSACENLWHFLVCIHMFCTLKK